MYSHAVPRHALGDVEVEEDLAHRQATTKQVEDAGEEHPAHILDTVVEVDYEAARPLAGWATRHSAGHLHTLAYHAMRKAKLVVLRRRTFLLPTMDTSRV